MDKIAEILLKISEETLENMSEPKRRLIQFLQEIYAPKLMKGVKSWREKERPS